MRFLADVEGYKGNPSYSVFYSVFLCSRFLLFTPKIQLHVGGKAFSGQLERYLCPRQMRYDLR